MRRVQHTCFLSSVHLFCHLCTASIFSWIFASSSLSFNTGDGVEEGGDFGGLLVVFEWWGALVGWFGFDALFSAAIVVLGEFVVFGVACVIVLVVVVVFVTVLIVCEAGCVGRE